MKLRKTSRTIGLLAGLAALNISSHAARADEGMKDIPQLQEKAVTIVTGKENWNDITGFGSEATMAEMMTMMMVGGSGMEHMKMGAMKPGMKMAGMKPGMKMDGDAMPGMPGMATKPQAMPFVVTLKQNPPGVGANTLDITVTGADGRPMTGLKLLASVAMTSMDMGTTRPRVTEGKGGHYTVTTNFSMKGPWRLTLIVTPPKQKAFTKSFDFDLAN